VAVPIVVRAAVTWLPEHRYRADEAVRDGRLDPADRDKLGVRELPVATESAPELAVRAGWLALDRAQCPPERLGTLIHAWVHHQGHDFWSPPHYIADRLGASNAVPFGVQQMCNGGSMAIQLAVERLTAEPDAAPVLVTTADTFADPGFDRWSGDYGVVYGDAATAVLLDRAGPDPDRAGPDQAARPGDDAGPGGTRLRVLAVSTAAAPGLESVHRGQDEFSPAPGWHSRQVDVRRTKKAFLTEHGPDLLTQVTIIRLAAVVHDALSRAGLRADDPRIRLVALPRLGRAAIDTSYLPALGDLASKVVDLGGAHTGHLGAGDTAANLAAILDGDRLGRGDVALVCGGGGGFTWSCLVVQSS
jgi:3-oxoacyl-[acyl-carrier-protein] synthase-3